MSKNDSIRYMDQDFDRRISIAVNHTLPAWQVLNAVAHISAHFGQLLGAQLISGDFFETRDGLKYPRNSQYPIIVLSAGPDQLPTFAQRARTTKDVQAMYFIREMIETTSDKEISQWLSKKDSNEVELLGVGIFGHHEPVKRLTSQFKLWS